MCQLQLQRLLQPHVSHSTCVNYYTLVAPDLQPPHTICKIRAPSYLDILPWDDRSLGRDHTLLPVMATRAKSTFLICPNILSSLFLLFCLIFLFLSLSPLFCNKSRANKPQLPHFRTMWLPTWTTRCNYFYLGCKRFALLFLLGCVRLSCITPPVKSQHLVAGLIFPPNHN